LGLLEALPVETTSPIVYVNILISFNAGDCPDVSGLQSDSFKSRPYPAHGTLVWTKDDAVADFEGIGAHIKVHILSRPGSPPSHLRYRSTIHPRNDTPL